MRSLRTLSIIAVAFCGISCRSGNPAFPPSSRPADSGRSVVIFPFKDGGVFSDRFYDLAAGELWKGRVVSRAVVAAEMEKLGSGSGGGRLTGAQAKAIAGRLRSGIVIAGGEESGGRAYVYIADLEARVAFVMRGYVGDSAGAKAFMDGIREYAGLSAHERETLAKVRFRDSSKASPVRSAAERSEDSAPSSPVPGPPDAGGGSGEAADISALNKIRVDVSELDAIKLDDLNLEDISTDDVRF